MEHAELFKNTFGTICDIKGPVQSLIMLLNCPVHYDCLEAGKMLLDHKSSIGATFEKGRLEYSVDEDSTFVINLSKKVYIYNSVVTLITNPDGNAYLDSVILCFQGMENLEDAVNALKERGLEFIDKTGTVIQQESFKAMYHSYLDQEREKSNSRQIKEMRQEG